MKKATRGRAIKEFKAGGRWRRCESVNSVCRRCAINPSVQSAWCSRLVFLGVGVYQCSFLRFQCQVRVSDRPWGAADRSPFAAIDRASAGAQLCTCRRCRLFTAHLQVVFRPICKSIGWIVRLAYTPACPHFICLLFSFQLLFCSVGPGWVYSFIIIIIRIVLISFSRGLARWLYCRPALLRQEEGIQKRVALISIHGLRSTFNGWIVTALYVAVVAVGLAFLDHFIKCHWHSFAVLLSFSLFLSIFFLFFLRILEDS